MTEPYIRTAARRLLAAVSPVEIKVPIVYDTSHYNGDIADFAAVNPRPFLWITKASEGVSLRDDQFPKYFPGMASIGVKRGAYHFHRKALNAITQANFYCNVVAPFLTKDDLIILDVEEGGESAAQLILWFKTVQAIYPDNILVIYSRKNILDAIGMTAEQAKFFKENVITWSAGYPFFPNDFTEIPAGYIPDTSKYGPCWLWQYYDQGIVEGINGGVDLNWIHPAFYILLNENGTVEPPPIGEPMAKIECFDKQAKAARVVSLWDEPTGSGGAPHVIRNILTGDIVAASGAVTNVNGDVWLCLGEGFSPADAFEFVQDPQPSPQIWEAVALGDVNVLDYPNGPAVSSITKDTTVYFRLWWQAYPQAWATGDDVWGQLLTENPGEWVFVRVQDVSNAFRLVQSVPEVPQPPALIAPDVMVCASGAMPLVGYDAQGVKVSDYVNENEITFRKVA